MRKKLPTKVKVGYKTYKIRCISKRTAEREEIFGDTDDVAAIIRIRTDVNEQDVQNVVLHEILHAVSHVFSIYPDDDESGEEERAVNAFANGLMTVFRDNPALLDYLKTKVIKE